MLKVLDITAPDINNGTGVRMTIWVSGCSHNCKGCQNKWTQDYNQGKYYKDVVYSDMDEWMKREYVSGITISGGDPLDQSKENLDELKDLLKYFREKYKGKNVWMYTGFTIEELLESKKYDYRDILKCVDVLIDGRFVLEKRDIMHYPFRGSSNQRLINVKDYL